LLKPSGPILHLSVKISLSVVVGVFMCVKNIIASSEVYLDVDFEMISFEVKGVDGKYTWKIIGIYRAPNDDVLANERSAARNIPW